MPAMSAGNAGKSLHGSGSCNRERELARERELLHSGRRGQEHEKAI